MSRHRQKYVDDYDDYDDYDDGYDDFGCSKPAAPPKPKPKKNKKKGVAAAAAASATATVAGEAAPPAPPSLRSESAPPPSYDAPTAGSQKGAVLAPAHSSSSTILFAGLSDDDEDSTRKHARAKGGCTEDGAAPCLTVIIAGHVDAGKSTLVGNLLFQTGKVSSRVIEAHQKEAERSGKSSFHFAWVTDESVAEREHGVTISAATKYIQTDHRQIALLDAPGHKDYVPNMIASAALADAALLVVPASSGEFETAISSSSQTREHAVLLKAMGCTHVVVVVNKMDRTEPAWSQHRYNRVCSEVRGLLESLQFHAESIQCIPVSGLTGANVVSRSPGAKTGKSSLIQPAVSMAEVCPWYSGPALLEALDALPIDISPVSGASSSLRAIVSSVSDNSKGCDAVVKLLRGRLLIGQTVGFLGGPNGVATVKSIRAGNDNRPLTELHEREQGQITLADRMGNDSDKMGLSSGTVLFKGPPRLRPASLFKAAIITMPDILPPIINGSEFEMFLLGREVVCCVNKICGHRDASTRVRLPTVKCIGGGRSAVVHISTFEPLMLEEFSLCRALGRFVLRSHGKTYAVGIVEKIY